MKLLAIFAVAGMLQVSTGSYAYAAPVGKVANCDWGGIYKCMKDWTGQFVVCSKNPTDTPYLTAQNQVMCRATNGTTYVPTRIVKQPLPS